MIKILFLMMFLFSYSSIAEKSRPSEAWLELTCRGVVTPTPNWPIEHRDITKFYLMVNPNVPMPSLRELSTQDAFMPQFEKMTRYCTDQRLKIVKTKVLPGDVYLDWGSDYGFTRFVVGDLIVPAPGPCRTIAQPCARTSQCCGYSNPISSRTTCDTNTNSCVSAVMISDPIESVARKPNSL